jgi:hypothetical protein
MERDRSASRPVDRIFSMITSFLCAGASRALVSLDRHVESIAVILLLSKIYAK